MFVVSHATNLGWDKETPLPETSASRAVFDAFCQLLRAKGVTGHLWHRPHRVPSETEFRKLVDETPGLKVALNLNANADLAKALARAGDKLMHALIGDEDITAHETARQGNVAKHGAPNPTRVAVVTS